MWSESTQDAHVTKSIFSNCAQLWLYNYGLVNIKFSVINFVQCF